MDRSRFISGLNGPVRFNKDQRQAIIDRSLKHYNWKTKCTVAMEELAELQQQVSKQIRGYNDSIGLLEEMADVYICLEFLKSIFNIDEPDLRKAMDVKLKREENILNREDRK